MAELLQEVLAQRAEQIALEDGTGALCWRELDARVNRWVAVLRAHGLRPGDRIAFVTGNRRATVEALLGCLHTGVIAVPVNSHLTGAEIGYILADSGARGVLVDSDRAANAAAAIQARNAAPELRIVIGERDLHGFGAAEPMLAQAGSQEPQQQCSGGIMLYTSGSTGHPKGVVNGRFLPGAPLARVTKLVELLRAMVGIPSRGAALLAGPWYHSAQLFFMLFPLLSGCRMVLHQRFDPAQTLHTIDAASITICHLVPTQFIRMLRLPGPQRAAFAGSSLERVWHGGGPCPVDVKRRMIDWWGPVLWEYYAATEGGIVTLVDSAAWLTRPGTVGRPVPPNELLILEPGGARLPPGQQGVVYLRRPPESDFHYYNAPARTAAAHLTPGTFTVGDVGYLDEDGFLFLTGRTDDKIVSGGVNVYPAEIEGVLHTHPAVRDVAVIGAPDEEFGERVVALVQLEPGVELAGPVPDVLDRHCRRSLAGFKVPRRYEVVGTVPREPNGKLRRHLLRSQYAEQPS